jgi:hypothetical protein
MLFEPLRLGGECHGTPVERPQLWTADRRQIGPPPTGIVRLDVTGPADGDVPEYLQVDRLRIDAADVALPINEELHD